MDFGTVKGVVYIQGTFQISRFDPSWDGDKVNDVAMNTLYSLGKKIRRIPGVSDVIFQLNNWKKEKGHWFRVKVTKKVENT
jgi:urate oxidase